MPLALPSLALAAALALPPIHGHPIHTAMAEITYDEASRIATIQVRAFADDFSAAVQGRPGPALVDSALARYARASLSLRDGRGRPLRLQWVGARLAGDVILLQLRADAPAGLAGGRVASLFLCERFRDQVNIVRVTYGGRSTTLLFTPDDQAKALP
jgi:hypothetical protein